MPDIFEEYDKVKKKLDNALKSLSEIDEYSRKNINYAMGAARSLNDDGIRIVVETMGVMARRGILQITDMS